jgi:hypothetical protein
MITVSQAEEKGSYPVILRSREGLCSVYYQWRARFLRAERDAERERYSGPTLGLA